jgi:hypothetical protein
LHWISFFTFLHAFQQSTPMYVSDKHRDATASRKICEWPTPVQALQRITCQIFTRFSHSYKHLNHSDTHVSDEHPNATALIDMSSHLSWTNTQRQAVCTKS